MLVLSRKGGESVAVGGRENRDHLVKVTVLGLCGTRVKLGFEAANDVAVHRWEVWQRINGETRDHYSMAIEQKELEDRWTDDGG
jgi:carbon storage regulator